MIRVSTLHFLLKVVTIRFFLLNPEPSQKADMRKPLHVYRLLGTIWLSAPLSNANQGDIFLAGARRGDVQYSLTFILNFRGCLDSQSDRQAGGRAGWWPKWEGSKTATRQTAFLFGIHEVPLRKATEGRQAEFDGGYDSVQALRPCKYVSFRSLRWKAYAPAVRLKLKRAV